MKELRCEGLYKSFDGVYALANVTARFRVSEITAIVGPNGAGKTTLVNILTGFLKPDSGRCFIASRNMTNYAPHRVAGLGVVRTFQDLRLILNLEVIENVLLGFPDQRGEQLLPAVFRLGKGAQERRNEQEALRLLGLVGLEQKARDRAEELSYGEQKLLTLACILATGAHTLIFDEPISGVHPEMAGKILRFLRGLRNDDKTIIFIEHDLSAVRQIAENILVMDEGKVIVQGNTGDVLDRPEILEAYLA
jgi:ABC-type branched-subunit amino acid transport system ATPase component